MLLQPLSSTTTVSRSTGGGSWPSRVVATGRTSARPSAVIRSSDSWRDPRADSNADPDRCPRWHHDRADPGIRGHRALVRGESQRVVREAALAGRQQLHPGHRHQRARDVAGRHVRRRRHRQGARLGRGPRHDDDARVPARSAVAAGPGRISARGSIGSSTSPRSITSVRCSCCSTRAGIRCRSWGRSTPRRRACTTPAGCRRRARRACRIRRSTRG